MGQRGTLESRATVRFMSEVLDDPRRIAIAAIVRIDEDGAFANVLLPKILAATSLDRRDRGFVTELVYGSTRMRRKLDHLVDRFCLNLHRRRPGPLCASVPINCSTSIRHRMRLSRRRLPPHRNGSAALSTQSFGRCLPP